MAKFCTNCGKELDENAALCLNCGVLVGNTNNNQNKEKKKGLPTWAIVLIIVGCVILLPIIVIIVIFAFAFKTVNNVIDNSFDEMWNENYVVKEGTIGDTLITDDFKMTLTDTLIYSSIGTDEELMDIPDEGKEYLVFFFEVENISNESKYISDFDFTGYADGYETEVEYLYNDINGIGDLDSTLLPNKKTKGYVAFELDTTWQEFEIHYSEWFDDEKLIFRVVNENKTNAMGA